ncbi:hypothetical protein QUA83_26015 [Microcoleus sp. K1-B1]
MANAREKFQEKICPQLVQENQVILVDNVAGNNFVKNPLIAK